MRRTTLSVLEEEVHHLADVFEELMSTKVDDNQVSDLVKKVRYAKAAFLVKAEELQKRHKEQGDVYESEQIKTVISANALEFNTFKADARAHTDEKLSFTVDSCDFNDGSKLDLEDITPARQLLTPAAPAHDTRDPVHGLLNTVHNPLNLAHGSINSAHPLNRVQHSLNPAQGSLNPAHGSINSAHSLIPAQGSLTTTHGSLSSAHPLNRIQDSLNPVQGSLNPANGSLNPAHPLNSVQDSLNPAQSSFNPAPLNPSCDAFYPGQQSVNRNQNTFGQREHHFNSDPTQG